MKHFYYFIISNVAPWAIFHCNYWKPSFLTSVIYTHIQILEIFSFFLLLKIA